MAGFCFIQHKMTNYFGFSNKKRNIGLVLGVYILLSRRIPYTHPFPDRGQLRLFQALQSIEGSSEPFMQASTLWGGMAHWPILALE